MKFLIVIAASVVSILNIANIDPNKIARVNKLKDKGEKAFRSENWPEAINSYSYLLDTLGHYEDEVALNLGHAYLKVGDTALATGTYQLLATSSNQQLKSKAYQQLGFISTMTKQLKISLSLFKASLIADPYNDISRYNYELIKKILNKQNEQDKKKDDLKKPEKPKEPSEYAKQLKMQAERLAAQFKYKQAIRLMEEGLKVDPSVAYFKDFVQRLTDISQIVESAE